MSTLLRDSIALVFDKTGTLTTNQLKVSAVHAAQGVSEDELKVSLGTLAVSGTAQNKTTRAIAVAFPATLSPCSRKCPFPPRASGARSQPRVRS